MDKCKKHLISNYLEYLTIVLAVVIYFVAVYPLSIMRVMDYDSSYQAALLGHSVKEIWQLIPTDFSPPLYAFFSKVFAIIFSNSVDGIRLSTLFIYVGLVLVCLFPLKRAFNRKVAIFTAVCFIFSTGNHWIFMQIRPHVIGYFFVTAAFVYACLVFKSQLKRDYILFTVLSILAMYSHTVAMLSMLGFYIVLLLGFWIVRDYKAIKNTFISGIVCAVAYIPWLFVLYYQFTNVKSNYWSSFIDFKKMFHAFFLLHFYDFKEDYSLSIFMVIFLLLVLGLTLYTLAASYKNKTKSKSISDALKENNGLYIIAALLLFMPVFIFTFINCTVAQIYVDRYVYNFAGICLIVICLVVSRIKVPKFDSKNYVMVLFAIVMAINFVVASTNYKKVLKSYNFMDLVEKIRTESDGDVSFVHANEWSLGIMMYYFPEANHYVTDDMFTVLTTYDAFPAEVVNIGNPEDISNYETEFYICASDLDTQKWSPVSFYFYSEDFDLELINEAYSGAFYGGDAYFAKVSCCN